ncbi:unnamed protein product [Discosporangium mesarthrocarpum]
MYDCREGMKTLLELGCGVGNAVFPLLEENKDLFVIAVDMASQGIQWLKQHPMYSCGRCEAHVVDATKDSLPPSVYIDGGVDLVLLQFCLSAVAPQQMAQVAQVAAGALKPGGKILLRDYGRYDEAQLRFGPGSRLGDNSFVRQDGTTSYFFSLRDLKGLFCGRAEARTGTEGDRCNPNPNPSAAGSLLDEWWGEGAGLEVEELYFVKRQYANRGQGVSRRRVWTHGKFRKPG